MHRKVRSFEQQSQSEMLNTPLNFFDRSTQSALLQQKTETKKLRDFRKKNLKKKLYSVDILVKKFKIETKIVPKIVPKSLVKKTNFGKK